MNDFRYALRTILKAPGLTAVLVVTLALGIGATTTIFSVVHSVVLRPLPYSEPDALVRIYTEFLGPNPRHRFTLSGPEVDDLRHDCRSCTSVAAWTRGSASLAGGDRPVRVDAAWCDHWLLPTLAVPPLLGRFFDESEDRPGGDPTVVVLGYDLWQRAFGGDPHVIGRQIHLDAMPVTVIGVMPRGFDFLGGEEAWVPAHFDRAMMDRDSHYVNVIARLAPSSSVAALGDELAALTTAWGTKRGPNTHAVSADHPMIGLPFQADLVGSLATTLWLLQGAVAFVLLISIVNVANLMLARSQTRLREVAVRHALGASRRRLIRQFATESMVVGLLGAALGILVAVWAIDAVTALMPKSAPRASEVAIDGSSIAFAIGSALASALLFGLAPILHVRGANLYGPLKEGAPGAGTKLRLHVRRALVVVEIAVAVVLVIGCTIMVRSFTRLQRVDLGFDPDRVLTFGVELPDKAYPGLAGDAFWDRLQTRLAALPGVTGVGLISGMLPERPLTAAGFQIVGRMRDPEVPWNVDYWQMVNADALGTLGARIVAGRGITRGDAAGAPPVVVVNQAFASRFFPGVDPVGQQIVITPIGDHPIAHAIVGVVADLRQSGLDKAPGTEIFLPYAQLPATEAVASMMPPHSITTMHVVLRTTGDPAALAPFAQRAVAELDPALPLFKLRTLDEAMWEAVARPRFLAFLLTAFAGLALVLAAIGIYGVMAHTVAMRTHEIGVRVALGAKPAAVRTLVLRQAAVLVGGGVAAGLAATVALEQALYGALSGLFYGASMVQPLVLVGVAVAVSITALLATWIPVRRATKVPPTVALRAE